MFFFQESSFLRDTPHRVEHRTIIYILHVHLQHSRSCIVFILYSCFYTSISTPFRNVSNWFLNLISKHGGIFNKCLRKLFLPSVFIFARIGWSFGKFISSCDKNGQIKYLFLLVIFRQSVSKVNYSNGGSCSKRRSRPRTVY